MRDKKRRKAEISPDFQANSRRTIVETINDKNKLRIQQNLQPRLSLPLFRSTASEYLEFMIQTNILMNAINAPTTTTSARLLDVIQLCDSRVEKRH